MPHRTGCILGLSYVDTWGEMIYSSLASYIHIFKRVSDVSKTVELLCSSDALVLRGMDQESVQVKNEKVSREGKFFCIK
jgi:hypothetical protein